MQGEIVNIRDYVEKKNFSINFLVIRSIKVAISEKEKSGERIKFLIEIFSFLAEWDKTWKLAEKKYFHSIFNIMRSSAIFNSEK